MPELTYILTHILLAHTTLVKTVEIRVKGDKHLLVKKGLAAERCVIARCAAVLVAQVLELLPLP